MKCFHAILRFNGNGEGNCFNVFNSKKQLRSVKAVTQPELHG